MDLLKNEERTRERRIERKRTVEASKLASFAAQLHDIDPSVVRRSDSAAAPDGAVRLFPSDASLH